LSSDCAGVSYWSGGSSGLLKMLRHEDVKRRARAFGFPQAGQLLEHTHIENVYFSEEETGFLIIFQRERLIAYLAQKDN